MTATIWDENGSLQWVATLNTEHLPKAKCTVESAESVLATVFPDADVNHVVSTSSGSRCVAFYSSDANPQDTIDEVIASGDESILTTGAFDGFDPDVEPELFAFNAKSYAWGLDRIDQEVPALDEAPYSPVFTGNGVDVYVIDSGVSATHSELSGRVTQVPSFSVNNSTDDESGHGTSVASIIAGSTVGVAPEANIISLKVGYAKRYLGPGNFTMTMIDAVQYVIDNAQKPALIHMSLGTQLFTPLDEVVQHAIDLGHTVVAAAGNSYGNACEKSPAVLTDVITVGAITTKNSGKQDAITEQSNTGECVDGYAPGANIRTANFNDDSKFVAKDGTSFSAPFVTGMLAQLFEKYDYDRIAARNELFELMVKSKDYNSNKRNEINVFTIAGLEDDVPSKPKACWRKYPDRDFDVCVDFAKNLFYGESVYDVSVEAPMSVPNSDNLDFCHPSAGELARVNGTIAVIQTAGCSMYNKILRAQEAGAVGVIIYKVHLTALKPYTNWARGPHDDTPITIPTIWVSNLDGRRFKNIYRKFPDATAFIGIEDDELDPVEE